MDKEVEFYAASKKPVESNPPSKNTLVSNKKEEIKKSTQADVAKVKVNKTDATAVAAIANNKQEAVPQKEETPQEETVIAIATKKSDLPATTIQTEQKKDVAGSLSKPEVKKQEIPVFKQEPVLAATTEETAATTKKSELVTTVKASEEKKFNTEASQASLIKITATVAALVLERKTVAPQIVIFKSDSLELALYDNGEIDGDTVSVLLNGEVLMTKQGLKASAIKKTIYMQPGTEEVTLVLYAENLGKYPPNTGLLVVHDGDDTYQVRFSADLQQNAAVVFRRKR